jgi:hypothetical protein
MDEPASRLRAALLGPEWLGYSPTIAAIDDLYNLSGLHMQVSGHARKVTTDHFKNPPASKPAAPPSIADFPVAALAAQVNA